MLCGIVNQNIDMEKREIILRACPIQVSVIHTHAYFTVIFRNWNNIGNPLWVGGDKLSILPEGSLLLSVDDGPRNQHQVLAFFRMTRQRPQHNHVATELDAS